MRYIHDINRYSYLLVKVLVFLCLAIFHFKTLYNFPPAFPDDALYASRTKAFIENEDVTSPLFGDAMSLIPGYEDVVGKLAFRVYEIPFLLLNIDDYYYGIRLSSYLVLLALLTLTYIVAASLINERFALISMFHLGTSLPFLYSSHIVRPDQIATLIGMTCLALLLYFWKHVSVHTFIPIFLAVGINTNPRILIFYVIIGFVYLEKFRGKFFSKKEFWLFFVASILSVAAYGLTQVLPYQEVWKSVQQMTFKNSRTPDILNLSFSSLFASLRMLAEIVLKGSTEKVLFGLSLLSFFFSTRSTRDPVYFLFFGLLLASVLLIPEFYKHNVLIVLPFCSLFLSYGIYIFATKIFSRSRSSLLNISLVFVVAVKLFLNSNTRINTICASDFYTTMDWFRQQTVEGEKTIGADIFWFARASNDFQSWKNLVYMQNYLGITLEEAFNILKPRSMVTNSHSNYFLRDKSISSGMESVDVLSIDTQEFSALLRKHVRQVDSIDTSCFGKVSLFKFR
jgi:hypothetical protein